MNLLMLWNNVLTMYAYCRHLFTQSWYFMVLWCSLSTRYPLLAVGKHTITSTRYRYHMSQPPSFAASPTFSSPTFSSSSPPLTLGFPFCLVSLPSLLSPLSHLIPSCTMLSTLRVASRSAAAREANFVVIGARQASAWSKVPQGPPVSLEVDF